MYNKSVRNEEAQDGGQLKDFFVSYINQQSYDTFFMIGVADVYPYKWRIQECAMYHLC